MATIDTFTAGESYSIGATSFTVDGITQTDFTAYTWFCTVKDDLSDTDEGSINTRIDSVSDSARFVVEDGNLQIQAVSMSESIAQIGESTATMINDQPLIKYVYVDVWGVDGSDNEFIFEFKKVGILKGVTLSRA